MPGVGVRRWPAPEDHEGDPDWFYDEDEGWQRRKPLTPEAALAEAKRDRVQAAYLRLKGDLALAGDDLVAVEAAGTKFDKALERAEQAHEQAIRAVAQGENMDKHEDAYTAAKAALTVGLVQAAADLKALEAKAATGEITERFAANERARIMAEAREAERVAANAFTAYRDGALAEARSLRARAAVGDANQTMADELLRARLMSDPRYDAETYAEEAQTFLEAGVPQRAALLLDVAKQKGARITGDLEAQINAALDGAVPDRKTAYEIEQAVEANATAYAAARAEALSQTLGMGPDGNIGDGSISQRTSAHVAATMHEHLAKQAQS